MYNVHIYHRYILFWRFSCVYLLTLAIQKERYIHLITILILKKMMMLGETQSMLLFYIQKRFQSERQKNERITRDEWVQTKCGHCEWKVCCYFSVLCYFNSWFQIRKSDSFVIWNGYYNLKKKHDVYSMFVSSLCFFTTFIFEFIFCCCCC